MNRSIIGLATSAWGLVACPAAEGEVIFNNLAPMNDSQAVGRIVQGESDGTIGNVDQASSFTAETNDYLLMGPNLGINDAGPPSSGVGPLDVLLAADTGGAPGAVLRTFSFVLNAVGDPLATLE